MTSAILEKLQSSRLDLSRRVLFAVLFFAIAVIATVAGVVTLKMEVSEAKEIEQTLSEEFERFNDPRSIFGNNFLITLAMFLPFFGPIWGIFVLFNTGQAIAILSIANDLPPLLVFASLLLTPVFWLEFIAYSGAMAQSIILLIQIFRRKGKKEAIRTCVIVTLCALLLFLSAVVEWVLINL